MQKSQNLRSSVLCMLRIWQYLQRAFVYLELCSMGKTACLQVCVAMLQIFALFLVHAYSTRVWKHQAADSTNLSAAAVEHGFQSPEGHSKLIMDGPWILLWPCLLLWPFFEGVIGFGFIHNGAGDAILLATPFWFCCLGRCGSARSPTALTVITSIASLLCICGISASFSTYTAFSSSGRSAACTSGLAVSPSAACSSTACSGCRDVQSRCL